MQEMHELCQPERVFQDPREEEGLMEAQFIWEEEEEEEVEEEEVPDDDPACYEFLWGPQGYVETSKFKDLEYLDRVD
ncbi:hypothetical protein CapIbe_023318 [Capra ibex]